jgi:PAS domain-containing protein
MDRKDPTDTLDKAPPLATEPGAERTAPTPTHRDQPLARAAPSPADALQLSELEAIFRGAPIALILVDRRRQVLRLNHAAGHLTGLPPGEMTGVAAGVALCCPHSDDAEEGCGFGPHCTECDLRLLVQRSFETRRPVVAREVQAHFAVAGTVQQRVLRVASSWLEIQQRERTLLCIEDVSEGCLPPPPPRALPG